MLPFFIQLIIREIKVFSCIIDFKYIKSSIVIGREMNTYKAMLDKVDNIDRTKYIFVTLVDMIVVSRIQRKVNRKSKRENVVAVRLTIKACNI
jgi:hypothetical protein